MHVNQQVGVVGTGVSHRYLEARIKGGIHHGLALQDKSFGKNAGSQAARREYANKGGRCLRSHS